VEFPTFGAVVGILLSAALSFLAAWYWFNRRASEADAVRIVADNVLRDARIVELEKQLALVSAAVVPISTAFQTILIKELTHYHTPELDALLLKIGPPATLSLVEVRRMEQLLIEREKQLDGTVSESERDAARMLPLVMKRAIAERLAQETFGVGLVFQVVGLPYVEPEPAPEPEPEPDRHD
jgi:hypothetical protein